MFISIIDKNNVKSRIIIKSSYLTKRNPLRLQDTTYQHTHTHTQNLQMKRKCVQGGMKMELRGENAKESTGRERGGRKCPRPDTLNELWRSLLERGQN